MWHLQLPVLLLSTFQVEGICLQVHSSKGWMEYGKTIFALGTISLAAGAALGAGLVLALCAPFFYCCVLLMMARSVGKQ